MDIKQIKELMAAMGKNGCTKLAIKSENFEIVLERPEAASASLYSNESPLHIPDDNLFRKDMAVHRAKLANALRESNTESNSSLPSLLPDASTKFFESSEDKPSAYITSPMVGTFYHSPSPQDPPFVKVGDKVEKNDVVCIIEAMKVMNEIKASIAGTIVEILVDNGSPVEFGAKLFRII